MRPTIRDFRSRVLFLPALANLALAASAQSVVRSLPGSPGTRMGSAIASTGDANNDGWRDYIVGTPGANGGRGGIVWISGAYLATGLGTSILFSYYPTATEVSADAQFGFALDSIGDLTGDGVSEFVVGAPFAENPLFGLVDCGQMFVFNGATRLPIYSRHFSSSNALFGWSISRCGDIYGGDGRPECIVGAPQSLSAASTGYAMLVTGTGMLGQIGLIWAPLPTPATWGLATQIGTAVRGSLDLDGDGLLEVAVGAPFADRPGGVDQGVIAIFEQSATMPVLVAEHWGNNGNQLGISVDGGLDVDGDGFDDLIAGATNTDTGSIAGRVVVLSGARLLANVQPIELYGWNGGTSIGGVPWKFGATVAMTSDFSGDGVADLLIGAPQFATTNFQRGAVWMFSGATGSGLGWYGGGTNERLGSALFLAQDLDGDGFREILAGGTDSDTPNTDGGVLKALRLFPSAPSTYCTGKLNSAGCIPVMNWSGIASATSSTPFLIGTTNLLNQRTGLIFYGADRNAVPFQGGVLCVRSPTTRTALANSAGSPTGVDCSGSFTLDFGARIQSGIDPLLIPGREVFCQAWSRDPASPSTTSLSNALGFLINP